MLTNRSEYYLRKDFGFIDLGLNGLLDLRMLAVYETLRRFVWRAEDAGHPEMRALCREGYLVARIAQTTLGTYVSLQRRSVNEYIATLRRLGWIKVVSFVDKNVGTRAYVLGETVQDAYGRKHEVYYADGMLRDLWDVLDTKAKVKLGGQATPLSLPIEERMSLVKEVLNGLADPEGEEDTPLSNKMLTPCAPECSPPEQNNAHPLSKETHTPCAVKCSLEVEKNLKVEKGEVEKVKAPPSASADPFGEGPFGTPTSPLTSPTPGPVTVHRPRSTEQLMVERREEEERRRDEAFANANAKEARLGNLKGRSAPVSQRKLIDRIETVWRTLYTHHYPSSTIATWERNGKERKTIESLITKYNVEIVELALTYALQQWEKLRERRFKGIALPSLGLILAAHETVFAEAQQFAQAMRVVLDTRAVWEKGGMTASLTSEQQALYDRAVKDLKVMGHEV